MTGAAAPRAVDAGALAPILRRAGSVIESTITGGSMGATLPPGTRIRIRCDPPGQLAVGAVIAFLKDGSPVAHRLVARGRGRGRDRLVTCGDAGIICDLPAPLEQVLGTVVACRLQGSWTTPADRPPRHGWRAVAAPLLHWAVSLALAAGPRAADTVVHVALRLRRWKAWSAGTPGHRA